MNVSLLDGWFPWTVQILAVVALLGAIGWRSPYWRVRRLPIAVGAGVGVTVLVALAVMFLGDLTDPLPFEVWIWLGVALVAVAVLVVGWGGARWFHRTAVPFAVVLAVFAGADAINISTGYYPTLGDAIGELSGEPVPQQMTLDEALKATGRTTTGRIVTVDIPDTASGFAHRQELVYLPPAWFRSKNRPKLPALEMIGGEFAAPDNWIRAGNAVKTADEYAAKHNGFAPVLVFVDATGGFKVDTECVNGPNGKAEDHLVKDVPPFVERTFNATNDPKKWGVAGWSMGGTCAIMLVTAHSDVFSHFLDISGDLGPNAGDKQSTIDKLYGGDAAAYDAHDPLTVMAHHGKYRNVTGLFESGDQEGSHIKQANELSAAGRQVGIAGKVTVEPGKHVWQFADTAFSQSLPTLAQQLGVPGSHPAPAKAADGTPD